MVLVDETVQIEINGVQKHRLVEHGLDPASPDNRIIGAALGQAALGPTTMLSNDAALRIKAAHLGVIAAEHRPTWSSAARPPRSAGRSFETSRDVVDELYRIGSVEAAGIAGVDVLVDNEFAVLRAGSPVCAHPARRQQLRPVVPWRARGVGPARSLEGAALRPRAAARSRRRGGRPRRQAGTGKTVLAIAAGLEQVVEHGRYERVASTARSCRSVRPTSASCRAGSTRSSIRGCRRSTTQVVALTDHLTQDARRLIDELTSRGQLSLESVTFLRGRSLQRQIVVIDEAQNLEPTTLKTILTRVGEGTKVIFTGDTSQIDAPYLGESNNALAVLTQAFRGQRCFGTSRSPRASAATSPASRRSCCDSHLRYRRR